METIENKQKEMPFFAPVEMRDADPEVVAYMEFAAVMRWAIQQSGYDDFEVAEKLGITAGYMSKVLHGTAGLYGKRLVRFMQITGSLAPLQWLAEQMGCDVVQRSSQAARIAALEQELAEAKKAAA